MFWLVDQPAFIDAVKAARYDSLRFAESTATKKHLGLEKTAGDTIAVLDPKKLHLMPLPQRGVNGLFNYMQDLPRRRRDARTRAQVANALRAAAEVLGSRRTYRM